jgi:aldose sugar dehydrogenase
MPLGGSLETTEISRRRALRRLPLAAAGAGLAACNRATSPGGQTAQPAQGVSPAQPAQGPATNASPTLDTDAVITGLDTPWAMAFAPDGRMFISERSGQIRLVVNGRLLPDPWMTLDAVEIGEAGLMGLALDPQFAQNRYVYAAYTTRTAQGQLQNRLVRLRDDPNAGPGGSGTMDRTLLERIPAGRVHDGARVKFGPDGKLYLTMGDAGNPQLAQDLNALNGKILRLNPDGSFPADNPFRDSPVYSYGHRNPQGLAWQPDTGRLYATEHGPSGIPCCRDEINLILPGRNYGWPAITGDQTREGMEAPILSSGTTTTWAPAGATFVTRGPWAGSFLFTGLRGQALFRMTLDPIDPRRVTNVESLFQGQFGRLRDVIEGPDGALYVATSNRDGRGSPAPQDDRIIRLQVR